MTSGPNVVDLPGGLAAQNCPRISPPRKVDEWTFT